MRWLNFHHLRYFWEVAREGSLVKAAAELRLAPSTISSQIRALEEAVGTPVFQRAGRGLAMTEMGRLVYRYAEEIFSLGSELEDAVEGGPGRRPLQLAVGVADVIPKLVARRLLEPLLRLETSVRLVCREDKPSRLLADLGLGQVDVVLLDAPVGSTGNRRAFSQFLGECGVGLFGSEELCDRYGPSFPSSLDEAPLLVPAEHTALRRLLELWFAERGLRPRIVGEFEDSALMKAFGQSGSGMFPAPLVIGEEVMRQHEVRMVGTLSMLKERFYAVSLERGLHNMGLLSILGVAEGVFGGSGQRSG